MHFPENIYNELFHNEEQTNQPGAAVVKPEKIIIKEEPKKAEEPEQIEVPEQVEEQQPAEEEAPETV